MTKGNVHQANAVRDRINETVKNYSRLDAIRNHVDAITGELASRKAFNLVNGQWVLSDRAWTDWIFSGDVKKYLDSASRRKSRGFETPKWLDFLLLGVIIVVAGVVSNLVATAQDDVGAGWGLFVTSLGLVLSLATRRWEKFRIATYYVSLGLGIGGLVAALISLVS